MADTSAAPKSPNGQSKQASAEALASRMAAALDVPAPTPEPKAEAPRLEAPRPVKAAPAAPLSAPAAQFPTPDLDGMYRLVKDGMTRVSKTVESVQDNARDTTKLMFGSRSIVTEHAVTIQRKMLEMMEANFTSGLRAIQSIASAGTVNDAIGIQSTYCQEALKTLQAQAETLRNLSSDLAKEVREPFEAQVTSSVERMKAALRPN